MKIVLLLISTLVLTFSVDADVTVTMAHESNGKTVDTTLSFAGERVRMDSEQGGIILTPSRDEMLMLIHSQKQYMKRSLNQNAAMNQANDAVNEKITFQKTGEKQVINGFACEQVIGTEADGDMTEFWVSKDSVHTDKFLASMKAFNKIQKNGQGGNQLEAWEQFFESNPELSTFPIRTIGKNTAGVVQSITTVKSISEDKIPTSRFEIPAGYNQLGGGGVPSPGEITTSTPSIPSSLHSEVLKELQALQQEIQKSGGRPTPAQMKRLQELATHYKVPQ